jgi:hypothetical protein
MFRAPAIPPRSQPAPPTDVAARGNGRAARARSATTEGSAELHAILRSEAKIVEMRTAISGRAHFGSSTYWANVHLAVGGLAAVLSAIAGASALSDVAGSYLVAGSLALTVTTLTAVATFLNPSKRANSHLRAGNAYLALENRARLFYKLHLLVAKPEDDQPRQLMRIVDELNELNTRSPQPSPRMFKKALRRRRNLRSQLTTAEVLERTEGESTIRVPIPAAQT